LSFNLVYKQLSNGDILIIFNKRIFIKVKAASYDTYNFQKQNSDLHLKFRKNKTNAKCKEILQQIDRNILQKQKLQEVQS